MWLILQAVLQSMNAWLHTQSQRLYVASLLTPWELHSQLFHPKECSIQVWSPWVNVAVFTNQTGTAGRSPHLNCTYSRGMLFWVPEGHGQLQSGGCTTLVQAMKSICVYFQHGIAVNSAVNLITKILKHESRHACSVPPFATGNVGG